MSDHVQLTEYIYLSPHEVQVLQRYVRNVEWAKNVCTDLLWVIGGLAFQLLILADLAYTYQLSHLLSHTGAIQP